MTDHPHWPDEPAGPEAMLRKGEKGDKGEPGQGMTAGARHAFVTLAVIMFVLTAAVLITGVRQINAFNTQETQIRAALHSQCAAEKSIGDLARLHVTVNPVTHKASKQLLGIISAHRVAWRGLGCTGRLDAASPSFMHWTHLYHLPES